jgi:hypothetical protein
MIVALGAAARPIVTVGQGPPYAGFCDSLDRPSQSARTMVGACGMPRKPAAILRPGCSVIHIACALALL